MKSVTYLSIIPPKPDVEPKPGTVVMTAAEVVETFDRIATRLDMLPALLDERTAAHFEMNREFEAQEQLARELRKAEDIKVRRMVKKSGR